MYNCDGCGIALETQDLNDPRNHRGGTQKIYCRDCLNLKIRTAIEASTNHALMSFISPDFSGGGTRYTPEV